MAVEPQTDATPNPPTAGPQSEVELLDKRFSKALQSKAVWKDTFQECYDYALPMKTAMYVESPATERTTEIYDETAVVAVIEFANRLQDGLIPAFNKWVQFVAGQDVPEGQRREVNAKLEEITEFVFEVIHNSNFPAQAHECLLEVAVGTASMHVGAGDYRSPINCKAIPLAHLAIDRGPDDTIDLNGHYHMTPGRLIAVEYPEATLSQRLQEAIARDPDKEIEVRQACWRDWSKAPELVYREMAWISDGKEVLFSQTYEGEGSNPYISFRWNKLANEIWGRGPLINALPAIKTCNLTVQLILENAEMAIAGFYTAENDGVVNVENIRIEPGTIVPVAPGSNGLQSVRQAGNFDVSQLILQDMRSNIKRALYNQDIRDPNKTPPSATQVSRDMSDLAKQIGASYGRLHTEFIQPFLRRVLYLLREQGLVSFPTVGNRLLKVQPQSPLSRAQQFQEVTDISNYAQLIAGMFGPEVLNILMKQEEAAPLLADKMGISRRILRSRSEIETILKQFVQQIGANQNGAASPQQAITAATRQR